MSKYIDADKLKRHYAWWDDEAKKIFDEIIDLQPAADVAEVRHGRWNWVDGVRCSVCNYKLQTTGLPSYCPYCGSRMDLEEEKNERI